MNGEEFIGRLLKAYQTGLAMDKADFPNGINLNDAYSLQYAFTKAKLINNNESLKGYKVSLTSPGTQALFEANEPLFGQMTNAQVVKGFTISMRHLISPLIELELIFLVEERITTSDNVETIIKKCQVAPGLEIPDSRFSDWFPKLSKEQVCADGAVGGRVVIGDGKDMTIDGLKNIRGVLSLNGTVLSEGRSSDVLGHPANAVKWLADKLAQWDLSLEPGMFISSGTFIPPENLQAGTYEGIFEMIGSVKLVVSP